MMFSNSKKIIVLLFIFSLVINIASMMSSSILWWDEGVYTGLGWQLKDNFSDYSFKEFQDNIRDDWTQAGFRSPLLPYIIAIFYLLFNSNFIIRLIVPVVSSIGVIGLYFLAKKMFDNKVGLFSAIIMASLPIYTYYSGKILTDVFYTTFIILSVLFFWMGFEEGKNKYKILCGLFCGLSILGRYSGALIILVLFSYFIIKNKNFNFLKDKWLLISVGVFLLVLSPWLYYSYTAYGNPVGFIEHSHRASTYWGGLQNWDFIFLYFPSMFSFGVLLFFIGGFFMIKNKKINDKRNLLFLWFLVFVIFVSLFSQHKETRYIMGAIPAISIIAGYSIKKMNKKIVACLIVLILLTSMFSLYFQYSDTYGESHLCHLKGLEYIKNLEGGKVFSYSSPVSYFYTHKESYSLYDLSVYDGKKYVLASDIDGSEDFSNGIEIFNCRNTTMVFEVN
jgi:4-amino-4-deoxy-L-arabinose transferase-like glycosyltransferase